MYPNEIILCPRQPRQLILSLRLLHHILHPPLHPLLMTRQRSTEVLLCLCHVPQLLSEHLFEHLHWYGGVVTVI